MIHSTFFDELSWPLHLDDDSVNDFKSSECTRFHFKQLSDPLIKRHLEDDLSGDVDFNTKSRLIIPTAEGLTQSSLCMWTQSCKELSWSTILKILIKISRHAYHWPRCWNLLRANRHERAWDAMKICNMLYLQQNSTLPIANVMSKVTRHVKVKKRAGIMLGLLIKKY